MNVLGDAIDEKGPINARATMPIHRRLRVGLTGLTLAEQFRDEGRDVLLFIDNIYRYTLAAAALEAQGQAERALAEQAADINFSLATAQLAEAAGRQRTLEELRKRRR